MTDQLIVHSVHWHDDDCGPLMLGVTVSLDAAERIANGWRFMKALDWWTDPNDGTEAAWFKMESSDGLESWVRCVIDNRDGFGGAFTGEIVITSFYLIDDRQEQDNAIPTGAAAGPTERPAARIAATAPDPGRPEPGLTTVATAPRPCVRWCGSDASCPRVHTFPAHRSDSVVDLPATCQFHE